MYIFVDCDSGVCAQDFVRGLLEAIHDAGDLPSGPQLIRRVPPELTAARTDGQRESRRRQRQRGVEVEHAAHAVAVGARGGVSARAREAQVGLQARVRRVAAKRERGRLPQ